MSAADMIFLVLLGSLAIWVVLGYWWDKTPNDNRILPYKRKGED